MIYNGHYISNYISYSLLKRFDEEGPRGLIKPKKSDNYSTRYGNLLDDYLFLEKEDFYNKYKVVTYSLPPILETLAKKVSEKFSLDDIDNISTDENLQKEVIKIIKNNSLYKNIKKDDTFITKFNFSEFYEYCKELYTDKLLVPISTFMEAKESKNSLYNNPKTKDLFTNNFENIYQLQVKFKYLDTKVKCYLDMVLIDHENKVIRGIDLKTGSPSAEEFMSNFFKYKYYLQASIYTLALHQYNKDNFNGEYTVEDFQFLYLCKFDINNPVIYKVSDKWFKAGVKGFRTTSGFSYRGVDELIKEVEWHKKNEVFNLSREFYENDIITLDDKFINIDE